MPQIQDHVIPTEPIGVALSDSTAEEEEVSNAIRSSFHDPLLHKTPDAYYIELVAYIARGQRAVAFKIDLDNDNSFCLYNAYPFSTSSGFPHIKYSMFDIDTCDWAEIHTRTKIDLSSNFEPPYPFLLVKRTAFNDEECPGIEDYYERLGGRRYESTPRLPNSPELPKFEGNSSTLPSPTPIPNASPPTSSPMPEYSTPVSGKDGHASGTKHSHIDKTGSITTFHINTINISISGCSHRKRALQGDDEELKVFSFLSRSEVVTVRSDLYIDVTDYKHAPPQDCPD